MKMSMLINPSDRASFKQKISVPPHFLSQSWERNFWAFQS